MLQKWLIDKDQLYKIRTLLELIVPLYVWIISFYLRKSELSTADLKLPYFPCLGEWVQILVGFARYSEQKKTAAVLSKDKNLIFCSTCSWVGETNPSRFTVEVFIVSLRSRKRGQHLQNCPSQDPSCRQFLNSTWMCPRISHWEPL